jgi:hypothetical protein
MRSSVPAVAETRFRSLEGVRARLLLVGLAVGHDLEFVVARPTHRRRRRVLEQLGNDRDRRHQGDDDDGGEQDAGLVHERGCAGWRTSDLLRQGAPLADSCGL